MTSLLNIFLSCNSTVCTDTRNITNGSLFIALKGDNFNGNLFAGEALSKGAKHVIVDENIPLKEGTFTKVENCLETLQELANEYRRTFEIPVLGITGSNGKTTAKELIHQVISKKYRTHSTPGNFNNHIGLPLTILSAASDTEFLILEMGDNHMGEIALLSEIGEPTFGLVTNVGKDHIEGFGSFENNKLAKKEIFDYITKTNGIAFIPVFEADLKPLTVELSNTIEFGSEQSFSSVEQLESNPFVRFKSDSIEVTTNLIGDYNIKNIEMAVAIGKYFKVETSDILSAISNYVPKNNRSQFIETKTNKVFLDAYNANPSSLELALKSFAKQNLAVRKVAVLGDMLELGAESTLEHQSILNLSLQLNIETILVGKEFSKVDYPNTVNHFENRHDLIEHLKKNPLLDSQILVKGSRGIRLEECLEML